MATSVESLRLILRNRIYLPITRSWRRKRVSADPFTIISNNCWGGTVYESYGIRKDSPTVGMFIMPEDYLRFVSRLDYYLSLDLQFVNPDQSKWRDVLKMKSNWGTYLVGKLDDVELHMLHYHDEEIARQKWNKRVKRVHSDRLLFKFNDQNGCTSNQIDAFLDLPIAPKVVFVSKWQDKEGCIYVPQPARYTNGVMASREPFGSSRLIDVNGLINSLGG